MLLQTGETARFLAHFTLAGSSMTGLSVTVYVHTPIAILGPFAATEWGTSGVYYYDFVTANPGTHVAMFSTAASADRQDIPSMWHVGGFADLLDVAVSSRLDSATYYVGDPLSEEARAALENIGKAVVEVVSPIAEGGRLTLIRGDSYKTTHGRDIVWLDPGTWTDFDGWSGLFKVKVAGEVFQKALVWSLTGEGAQQFTLELTSEETAAFVQGSYKYDLEVTLATDQITLVRGQMVVESDVR